MVKLTKLIFPLLLAATVAACLAQAPPPQATSAMPTATMLVPAAETETQQLPSSAEPSPSPEAVTRFAVIGDYGQAESIAEGVVAEMVAGWNVDLIVTAGDNNYPYGSADTIDQNIGQFYHAYIGNYAGQYGAGSDQNRFFPSLGNHDWELGNIDAFLDYFTLPGNERYYDLIEGPVQFFILDSDPREPDGVSLSSEQAAWLQEAMRASASTWQVVVMHHPPYSSGMHGSTDWMQWAFADWGADVVISGHDHLYERLDVDGLTYITNGLGGSAAVYDFVNVLPGSLVRYNAMHGALRGQATSDWLLFEFINTNGDVIDSFRLDAPAANP